MTGGTLPLMIAPWTPSFAPVYPAKKQALTPQPPLAGPSTLRQGARLQVDLASCGGTAVALLQHVLPEQGNWIEKAGWAASMAAKACAMKPRFIQGLQQLGKDDTVTVAAKTLPGGGVNMTLTYVDVDGTELAVLPATVHKGQFTLQASQAVLPEGLDRSPQGALHAITTAYPEGQSHTLSPELLEEALTLQLRLLQEIARGPAPPSAPTSSLGGYHA